MVAVFKGDPRCHIRMNKSFNGESNGYTAGKHAEICADSIFVLGPFGNLNPDTFRIMEALHRGAIPVSVKMGAIDCFKSIFRPKHPFIVGKDWEDAREQCRELLDEAATLLADQTMVERWFSKSLKNLSSDLGRILTDSVEGPLSPMGVPEEI